jgi:hypothetical protein
MFKLFVSENLGWNTRDQRMFTIRRQVQTVYLILFKKPCILLSLTLLLPLDYHYHLHRRLYLFEPSESGSDYHVIATRVLWFCGFTVEVNVQPFLRAAWRQLACLRMACRESSRMSFQVFMST